MAINLLREVNWVDILVVILVLRIIYIALKGGLPVELFKFLGTVAATYFSLHYYTVLSDFLRRHIPLEQIPLDFLDFLSFLVLAAVSYLALVLLRSIFYRFIKMEALPNINKWGGLSLGLLRSILLSGLVIFTLAVSSIGYLNRSAKDSYVGRRLFKVTEGTYTWLWEALGSKFMPKEKFNKTIDEVREGFYRK